MKYIEVEVEICPGLVYAWSTSTLSFRVSDTFDWTSEVRLLIILFRFDCIVSNSASYSVNCKEFHISQMHVTALIILP